MSATAGSVRTGTRHETASDTRSASSPGSSSASASATSVGSPGAASRPNISSWRSDNPTVHDATPPPRASASGQDHLVVFAAQHLDHEVAMVALGLDDAVLDRASDAAALLQAAGQCAHAIVVERDVGDGRHGLAAAAGDLATHLHAAAGGHPRL